MSLTNGELFLRLIRNIKSIYKKELTNESFIYLYKSGDYWVAFEKSAYFLSLQLKELESKISVLHMKEFPFPILFISLDDFAKQKLYRTGISMSRNFGPYIKIKTADTNRADDYYSWYQMNLKLYSVNGCWEQHA